MQDEPSQPTDIEQPERLDLELLVMGKRSGLSFDEINELTVNDLLKYVNIYVDMETGKRKPRRRMATQADIDAFFA
ncbi:hypothetical protein IC805_05195 [Geobacillus thermoleovorans]|uniref:hypothetical protein n=1 Tax=Geobacillus thermoleovorans TaxID=33941 RepID=UPI0009BCC0F1|nr:hypothetical protein [Geobacillus thermoleovorans]OQP13148.1 hypothetical protein B1692_08825 [Geobacillus thermoleovorans]QNU22337.1 hypothetical protein IC805_05195 [Geobacillus thermoleovorans]